MHITRKLFILLCLLISLLSLTITAQENDLTRVHFEVDSQTPIIRHGRSLNDWDSRNVLPATVFYHDGQFHMFRTGNQGWLMPTGVGYATSSDALIWDEPQQEPVFPAENVPIEGIDMTLLSSGFIDADGTWVLYFFLIAPPEAPQGMIRATAPDPLGPWTMDDDILLTLGGEGEWDSDQIGAPHVMLVDGEYRAYYFASGGIGMATSPDGINWTKYDDPSTTEAPYAESDPVFLPSEDEDAWDYEMIQDPTVLITPDGWVMLYSSFQGVNSNFSGGIRGYGLAISDDGINWERLQDEPAWVNREDMRSTRDTWYAKLAYHEETYYFYIQISGGLGTDIYAGFYEGLLTP